MSCRIAFLFLLLAGSAVAQTAPDCYPVADDQIIGRDLAMAVPQLAAIPPSLTLGYAPTPGAIRIFHAAQLQQLGRRYGVKTPITAPVCFAWPMRQLSGQEIASAIKKSLGDRSSELQITDQSRASVPPGELVFPMQGLTSETDKPAVWNGYVRYAGNRRYATWVQVRIIIHEDQLVTVRVLPAGEVISQAAFKKVEYVGPLRRLLVLRAANEAIGKCTRWQLPEGTVLTQAMLSLPLDVQKQDLVTVHTICGAAHIETQGIAVDGGYIGGVIRVKNPKTARVFRAKIDDRGVVTVVPGGEAGLVVEEKKS